MEKRKRNFNPINVDEKMMSFVKNRSLKKSIKPLISKELTTHIHKEKRYRKKYHNN